MFSMGEFSDKMKIENCWKTVIGNAIAVVEVVQGCV